MEMHKASRERGFVYKLLEDSCKQWGGCFCLTQKWKRSLGLSAGGTVGQGAGEPCLSTRPSGSRAGGLQEADPLPVWSCAFSRWAQDYCCLPPKLHHVKRSALVAVKSCRAPTDRVSSLGWKGAPSVGRFGGRSPVPCSSSPERFSEQVMRQQPSLLLIGHPRTVCNVLHLISNGFSLIHRECPGEPWLVARHSRAVSQA